jgi:hypothetical protein
MTEFDAAVNRYRELGTFKLKDADRPLTFVMRESHVLWARRKNEGECAVALALADAQPTATHLSVGHYITKVLFDSGVCIRYHTPLRLREALKHFDQTGLWDLPPGEYSLLPPRETHRLMENQSEARRAKLRQSWDKLTQKVKTSGPNGVGVHQHKGKPVPARHITIVRGAPPRNRRKKKVNILTYIPGNKPATPSERNPK